MDNKILIRKFEERDLAQLKALYELLIAYHMDLDAFYYEKDNNFDAEIGVWLRTQMQNTYTQTFVADADGRMTGFINTMCKFWPGWYRVKETGFISYAFVLESFRGLGIGQMLFDAAENWSREKRHPYVEVYVHSLNDLGIKAWTKYGMEEKVKYLTKKL